PFGWDLDWGIFRFEALGDRRGQLRSSFLEPSFWAFHGHLSCSNHVEYAMCSYSPLYNTHSHRHSSIRNPQSKLQNTPPASSSIPSAPCSASILSFPPVHPCCPQYPPPASLPYGEALLPG